MNKLKRTCLLFSLTWKLSPYLYFSSLISSIISVVTILIYMFIPKYIIDALIAGESWRKILGFIGIFIGAIIITKFIDLFTKPWRNACSNRADIKTVDHYMNLSARTQYSEFEKSEYKDKLETAMGKVRLNVAANFFSGLISSLIGLVICGSYIISLSPWVFMVVIFTVTAKIAVKMLSNKLEEKTTPDLRRNGRVFNYINDTYSSFKNAKEIRVNQTKELFEARYNENIQERWKLDTYYCKRNFLLNAIFHVINIIQLIFVYGYAGQMALKRLISIGSFSAYAASVINFSNSSSTLFNTFLDFNHVLHYVPLYVELLELSKAEDVVKKECADSFSYMLEQPIEICFENVSFRYPNCQNYVLQNINIKLNKGCKLAIVGENGAGKSTFIKLLCRLYKPTEGKITINGVNIENISRESYGKILSVVFQDFKLFSFDVADNIMLNSEHDIKKLIRALDKSDLTEKMKTLENGVNTYVNREFDEHGVEFSGGEAQKLMLARSYYKDSPIVILDEPTASLDPKSEVYFYDHFKSVIGNKSAIFISHRLASTSFCDKIAVFSKGSIVEFGTHKELLKLNGIYAEMWKVQASLYVGKGNHS